MSTSSADSGREHVRELEFELIEAAREYVHQTRNGRHEDIEPARKEFLRAVDEYEAFVS